LLQKINISVVIVFVSLYIYVVFDVNVKSKSGLRGSRRRLLIVVSLVVIVIVLVSCFVVYRSLIDNSSIRVKNAAELRNAVNSVEVGVPVTIVFANDISLGPTLDIPVGADIILTSAGGRDFFRLIGLVGQNVITVYGKLTLDTALPKEAF
jgi:hypothetical protein